MSEGEKKGGELWKIAGAILLILALFVGVQLIFSGLERAIPKERGDVSQSASSPQKPSDGEERRPLYCVHCGEKLPEDFQWGWFCPYCGEMTES